MRHLDDEGILDLFYERSEQAVAELEQKYGGAVRRTAANILRDRLDVEECLNDTWLAAWNTIPPQRPERESLKAWQLTFCQSIERTKRPAHNRAGLFA